MHVNTGICIANPCKFQNAISTHVFNAFHLFLACCHVKTQTTHSSYIFALEQQTHLPNNAKQHLKTRKCNHTNIPRTQHNSQHSKHGIHLLRSAASVESTYCAPQRTWNLSNSKGTECGPGGRHEFRTIPYHIIALFSLN